MISATTDPVRYVTRFSDGVHTGIADAPVVKGGTDSGFRPFDLLEAALATCVAMTVRMYADQRAIPLECATVRVTTDRTRPDELVFRYEVELEGDLTAEQREKVLRAASACPVRRSLMKQLRFEPMAETIAPETAAAELTTADPAR
jgi:putative redox protein